MKNETRVRRRVDVQNLEGTILVRRIDYTGKVPFSEREKEDKVRVPVFETEPARVRVVGSVTRNLGNYNSARIEVMVELPAYPVDSELEHAYRHASRLVDQWIREELAALEPQEDAS